MRSLYELFESRYNGTRDESRRERFAQLKAFDTGGFFQYLVVLDGDRIQFFELERIAVLVAHYLTLDK